MSASKFDELVRDGRMPQPSPVDGMKIWDRDLLTDAFKEMTNGDKRVNQWDEAAAA